jgi:hypothetical protein
MVTEQNDPGQESQVEVTDVPLSLDETQAPAKEETPTEQVAETTQDLNETADSSIEVSPQSEPQTQSSETVSKQPTAQDELRKYQSATDKQIAEMREQLKKEQQARALAEQQTNANNLNAEVANYTNTLYQQYIDRGFDESTAKQEATRNAAMAKEAYMAKVQADSVLARQRQVEQELNSRTQLAKAYELASQHQVPYTELQDFSDPVAMERHAKALSRINKLEKSIQSNTPGQQMTGASPAADVAPTNSEDVIDRYNAGDPAVTTDMARTAAKKLGLSIFG